MIFKKVADLTIGSSTDIACTLLGYYNPGDGGGGELYWDPTSAQTADNGTIFQVGTNSGRWIRVDQSKLFPEYFGAIGDSDISDESTALNNCKAFIKMFEISAEILGHCVLLANKTYVIKDYEIIKKIGVPDERKEYKLIVDSKTLSLDGNGATLQAHNGCEGVFITVTSSNSFNVGYSTASHLFKNLNIIGPEKTDIPKNVMGIKSSTVGLNFYGEGISSDRETWKLIDNKLISSVTIKRFDVGVDIFSNVWCLSFDKCTVKNCCVGVNSDKYKDTTLGFNYGENLRFNSCNISNNQLGIMNNGLDDLSFEGTSIDYNDCMVQVSEGRTKFINCYIERGNDQGDVDYWIKMCGDGNWVKLFFDNCEFVFAQSEDPSNNTIEKYEIVYVNDVSSQPGSVVVQRSKINITNYKRLHFMFSSTSNNNLGGGIMQGNFYLPGYDGDHTRDFIPSVAQNSIRNAPTNDYNYSGWTFYTENNINEQAYWDQNVLILSPNLQGHKRFAYYDVNVYEQGQTISLLFLYQLLTSDDTIKLISKLQAIDEAGNVISDLETLELDRTNDVLAKPNESIQWSQRIDKWGTSSKDRINKRIIYTTDSSGDIQIEYVSIPDSIKEGNEAEWGKIIRKHYSALPRGTKSIRLLFEGTDNSGDICKIKNIELCLE